MKKLLTALSALLLCLLLAGCGSLFEKEYVSVTDYVPPAQAESDAGEKVTVRNMAELKKAIISMVYEGSARGSIAFDPNYDGNASEDMEMACWQVRTQDALCAYCVRDLSYELEKIVNYYESTISIDYTSYATELSNIVRLPYSVGLQDILSAAMEENRSRVTLLIDTSSTTTENVRSIVLDLYRKNPTICVREPQLTVYMYSGAGRQRLYEINFRYGMAEDELIRCKAQLKNLDVVSNLGAEKLDDPHRALAACRYLTENCRFAENAPASCFDALIQGESNSEGLALAYVELCHQLGIECRIVHGQYDGVVHCWNVIRLNGSWYHVDVSRCYDGRFEDGFLLNDESMWNDYRWTISSYPACTGGLHYADLTEEEALPQGPNGDEDSGEDGRQNG
ncbi:MAG: transglutaminase domain-containing protein [Oscillospiraceae bacterium]|nr:transglutaminase domain-containing protein [Oscillospiraceae bacterium]